MSFNWIDLLDVAVDLLEGNNEAYFRSSINRAYYAMFGRTRQILETEEKKIFQPPNVHKQVIDYFIVLEFYKLKFQQHLILRNKMLDSDRRLSPIRPSIFVKRCCPEGKIARTK